MNTKNKIKNYHHGGMREILFIALPMMLSFSCETVMTFTNRLFLSHIDPIQMNASMSGGLTVFMMMSFFMGLTGYTTALSAQYLGANQKSKCSKVLFQAILICLISYPIILLLKPAGYLLFEVMKVPSIQMGYQKIYYSILLYGIILGLLRSTLSAFFSGIGKTRIVMVASFSAMIANVFASYVLIFGKFGFLGLGIRGGAYASIIGELVSLIILLTEYLKKNNREEFHISKSFHFDFSIMKKLLKFGTPPGLELFLNMLAFNVVILIFHSLGPVIATASTIVFNWDMVSFIPLLGVEIGVTSLVGRYMGSGSPHIAHKSAMSGVKLGLVFSSIVLICFICIPNYLVYIFRPDVSNDIFLKAFPIAVNIIKIAAFYVLVEAVMLAFVGALRGAGDSFWAMVLSVSFHWLLVPVIFVMLKVFNFSPEIGFLSMVILFFIFAFLVYLRYNSGKWKHIKVIETPEPELAIATVHSDFHEPKDI
jgi:multidrug resistance protein, MATE family